MNPFYIVTLVHLLLAVIPGFANGQTTANVETELKSMKMPELIKLANRRGDPRRGALVFYKSAAACVKCHLDSSDKISPLGPALTELDEKTTDQYIIESILYPSKKIKEGYESVRILTFDGKVVTGLLVKDDGQQVVLRDTADLQREIVIDKEDIDTSNLSTVSVMPEGLIASLREPREFYDLVRYVAEVARGGPLRAKQLRPAPELLVVKDDTTNLDHAGILSKLNAKDFQSGNRIYNSHCINCHGADGNKPTLSTARAFGKDKLKFGADPLSMLGTLTQGNGLMGAMQHLSPKERYQVIHFIRESFMKGNNPDYVTINREYLGSLPKGNETGEFLVGNDRDFGPVLGSQLGTNINHSLTFRLSDDITVNYDMHRFRLGGVWRGGFLDLSQTQHYRQRGEGMPRPVGKPIAGMDDYVWELGGSFDIPPTIKPPRGPVQSNLANYLGHYLYDDQAVLSYEIGGRGVLETITSERLDQIPIVRHTFRVAAGDQPLRLCVGRQTRPGVTQVENTITTNTDDGGRGASTGNSIAFVPNLPAKPHEAAANSNQAIHVVSGPQAKELDLGTPERTIVVRFKTRQGGTLIASAPATGKWAADGKTLFIRGKQLVFDIGWVGAISGKRPVTDGQWHTAALVVTKKNTQLYVDGKLEATKAEFRRNPVNGHVLKIGATATNFGGDFDGEIDWASVYDKAMTADQLVQLADTDRPSPQQAIWAWKAGEDPLQSPPPTVETPPTFTVAGVTGDTTGLTWGLENQRLILTIPAGNRPRIFTLNRSSMKEQQLQGFTDYITEASKRAVTDPLSMTKGGATRWPQRLKTTGSLGESVNGYALDTISLPSENPWNAWLRTSALDFFEDGRCVVTTHGGDVYLVSGIDTTLQNVTWKRYAAGLFEPFGVRVIGGQIYVTCRDGIKRLHDFDGNDEADFIEAFWIDDDVSSMFHAYNFDLQTDSQGNFYFAKAGQYTNHHRPGTIMKIPPDGGSAEVVAWGIRTPNGMGKLKDDRFTVSDNQGPWMPAGKISLVKPKGFFGNMPINQEQDQWLRGKYGGELPESYDEPFIWMPQELDNSCGGQIWAGDERWGPLAGRLIHSSFGKGWLYYMSLQEIAGTMQSSIVSLPHQWQAGVMRLRVNPTDGQMYGTGLSGWQGPKGGKDGCLQRLRYTGNQVRIIDQVRVVPNGIELTFNFELSNEAFDTESWDAKMWNYLWSRKYGSDQFSVLNPGKKGRDKLRIESIDLSENKRTLTLHTPDLKSCDQVHIEMGFSDANGQPFSEEIYLTIHSVPER
ncbi:MAG: c-type cytochrome [Rubripirellula sp.]|nr:c-type cytochrome [Rubripirellula sp.]